MPESLNQFTKHPTIEYSFPHEVVMRRYFMTRRQTIIMELAEIEKMLGLEPTRPRNQQRRIEVG